MIAYPGITWVLQYISVPNDQRGLDSAEAEEVLLSCSTSPHTQILGAKANIVCFSYYSKQQQNAYFLNAENGSVSGTCTDRCFSIKMCRRKLRKLFEAL